MKQKLLIRDLTLRDGQQSAFATRMNQSQGSDMRVFVTGSHGDFFFAALLQDLQRTRRRAVAGRN